MTETEQAVPARIESLDLVRGIATLGILLMNSIAFALDDAAYSNLDEGGTDTLLDSVIGVVMRVLVDQKMMALFSLLFGVGVVIFAERAAAKGRRPVGLSLWRNLLLFAIGILHTVAWDGDVLTVYAVCAPLVLLARRLPAGWLLAIGVVLANLGSVTMLLVRSAIDPAELGSVWTAGAPTSSDAVDGLVLLDAFGRALGLMLIGVGLFRLGVVQGRRSERTYGRMVIVGLAIGLPVSINGLVVHTSNDWAPSSGLDGFAVSTMATVPLALAWLGGIVLWTRRATGRISIALQDRLRAVGRMALTNYLTQTLVGLVVLTGLLGDAGLSRTMILVSVVAVWDADVRRLAQRTTVPAEV